MDPTGITGKRMRDNAAEEEKMQKKKHYAIATTDTAFKHMFSVDSGKDDIIMRSFLRAFVPCLQKDVIETIEPGAVSVPILSQKGEKQTFMDLRVRTKSGERFIVEMQVKRHLLFDERALHFACLTYSTQLSAEERRDEHRFHALKPVIVIQVLDYDSNRVRGVQLPEGVKSDPLIERVSENPLKEGQYIKHYMLTDSNSGQQVINHLQMIQVELPRAKRTLKEKDRAQFSETDWWVELLCYSSEYTDDVLDALKNSGVNVPDFFVDALKRLDMEEWAGTMQKEYETGLTDRNNYGTVLAVERKEGREEGIQVGREEGAEEKTKEVVRKMLLRGKDDDEIRDVSGCSEDVLQEIKASLKTASEV
jgi:predicted transposase/invertase (TIGR01784 family)